MLFSSPSGTHKEEVHWNLKAKTSGIWEYNKRKVVHRDPLLFGGFKKKKKSSSYPSHTDPVCTIRPPCVNNDAMDIYTARRLTSALVCSVWAALGSVVKKKKFKWEKKRKKNKGGGGGCMKREKEQLWWNELTCSSTKVPLWFREKLVDRSHTHAQRERRMCDFTEAERTDLKGGGARNFNNEWPPTPPPLHSWTEEPTPPP